MGRIVVELALAIIIVSLLIFIVEGWGGKK